MASGLADKAPVESEELPLLLAVGQVQGIGKIQPLSMPLNGLGDDDRICQMDIGQAEESGEGSANPIGRKLIGVSQYPFRLQDDAVGDEDIMFLEQLVGSVESIVIVMGKETNNDIRINRDHRNAPLRLS